MDDDRIFPYVGNSYPPSSVPAYIFYSVVLWGHSKHMENQEMIFPIKLLFNLGEVGLL
jgi:hypothetical protein